ncbi:MAG: V/A-type H+-transporting ATPase subunit E [Halioglobus sp.]|jgi:V/A-type H+-transporting ATPase subunit E
MSDKVQQSSGVQELISRIRDDGVQAGQSKAEEIIAEAWSKAARILEQANTEAEETRKKSSAEIESFKSAALEALKMAARDTRLQLEAGVLASFEAHVKRLMAPVEYDSSFLRAMLLVLAGQAADQYPRDQKLEILVSDLLAGHEHDNEELDTTIRESVLGISGSMLREGIEIIPTSEVAGGVRVRVVGEDLEIDLTSEAVSSMLLKHLLPRYRGILDGSE